MKTELKTKLQEISLTAKQFEKSINSFDDVLCLFKNKFPVKKQSTYCSLEKYWIKTKDEFDLRVVEKFQQDLEKFKDIVIKYKFDKRWSNLFKIVDELDKYANQIKAMYWLPFNIILKSANDFYSIIWKINSSAFENYLDFLDREFMQYLCSQEFSELKQYCKKVNLMSHKDLKNKIFETAKNIIISGDNILENFVYKAWKYMFWEAELECLGAYELHEFRQNKEKELEEQLEAKLIDEQTQNIEMLAYLIYDLVNYGDRYLFQGVCYYG